MIRLAGDNLNWVLIYSTASSERQGGVGILMSRQIFKCLQGVKSVSDRIIIATFHGNHKLITSVYAPTEGVALDDKNGFYNCLTDHLEPVKTHNIHLLVEDFNARIGSDCHLTHPEVIGCHCFYNVTNVNGEKLVAVCEEHKLRLHK